MGYSSVTIGPLDKSGPSTRFYAVAEVISQNVAGNYSVIRQHVICYNGPNGNSSSYSGGPGGQSCSIDAYGISAEHTGNPFLPSGYAQNQLRWDDWNDQILYHDANGYLGPLSVRMGVSYSSVSESHWGTLYVDRIVQVPSKPPRADFRFGQHHHDRVPVLQLGQQRWLGRDRLGPPVCDERRVHAEPPDLGGLRLAGSGHRADPRHHALHPIPLGERGRVQRLVRLAGADHPARDTAWSQRLAVPVRARSHADDDTARRSVRRHRVQLSSSASLPPAHRRAGSSPTSVVTVPGLTPGTSYEWRANAEIGGYTSPWTEWQAVLQPNPNTNPGDYFDGSTTDTLYSNYGWTGAVNNSTSTALAPVPIGWEGFTDRWFARAQPGVRRLESCECGARHVHLADSTGAGQFGISGQPGGDVAGNALYYGSMYVRSSRSQRIHCAIIWLTVALA